MPAAARNVRKSDTASPAWVKQHNLTMAALAAGDWRRFPEAEVVAIQARGEFHRMDPMEVIATDDEVAGLLHRFPDRQYLVFPEDRKRPIRMFEDLPLLWVQRGPTTVFSGTAQPGEFYPFQLGVWAARKAIRDLRLTFSALRSEQGGIIPATALRCFNLGGTDWLGRPMKKTFAVGKGLVRPLWIGVDVPEDAAGEYQGTVVVQPGGLPPTTIRVRLTVTGPILTDHGDSELWRYSRLRWPLCRPASLRCQAVAASHAIRCGIAAVCGTNRIARRPFLPGQAQRVYGRLRLAIAPAWRRPAAP